MGEAKARLHEYCYKNNFTFDYHIDVEGPPHDPVFTVAIEINNRLYDSVTGKSKKDAKSSAAVQAWKTIEQELQADAASSQMQRPLPSSSPQVSQVPPSSANIAEVSSVVNYIGWLNEYKQKKNVSIEYISEKEAHVPIFSIACKIGNKVFPEGTGGTKQAAKLNAAKLAYEELNTQPVSRADAASSRMQRPLPSSSPQASQVPPSSANISEVSHVVNYISWLNEYKQKKNVSIEYISEKEADVPIFSVACKIGNKVFPEGTGGTKHAAKLNAAKLAYEELNTQPVSRAEQSATSSNNSVYMPLSNSQEVLESSEKFDQKVTGFTSNTSNSVIFQPSGASSNATDSGNHSVDRLNDALVAVKLDETSSWASPKGPGTKPKRKETPLAPKFSNLVRKESKYTNNARFLQDYDDIKRIGSGGFGNVFKAKHLITGSVHAIKRVALSCKEEKNEEETKGEEAEREVQVLANLEHENIVRYYTCWIGKDSVPSSDSSLSDDSFCSLRRTCKCLFIEMEFCENGMLETWISETRNTQSHEDSLKKFQQIVEGVHYIHSKNIIHRDLKPANIFISKDNKIKIGDFGLATSGIDDLLVPRTANKGTKRYMAPEQFGNTYGKEVDLYPLGLIFFELVCVFSTDSEKIMQWQNIRDCKFPEVFVKKFPTEISIISKLLSKNPVKRPSATMLLNILKNNVERLHTC